MKRIRVFAILMILCGVMLLGCSNKNINTLNLDFNFTINDNLDDGNGENVKVILLAGQSNATGVAYHSILKDNQMSTLIIILKMELINLMALYILMSNRM